MPKKPKGLYSRKPSQNRDTPADERCYFHADHKELQPSIASIYPFYEGTRLRVQYLLEQDDDDKLYVAPAASLMWLKGEDLMKVEIEIERWMNRVNARNGLPDAYFPDYFLKQRTPFLKYMRITAKAATINGYVNQLGRYVFPFFLKVACETKIEKWADHYVRFRQFLINQKLRNTTINRIYTSLRRYLSYLEYSGVHRGLYLPPAEPISKEEISGKNLPGGLPDWEVLLRMLRSLPPGFERWVVTMCVAFGVRVSEAFRLQPEHLIGGESFEKQGFVNSFVERLDRNYNPYLFANITEAEQRIKLSPEVLRVLGEDSDDPKSGDYWAVCIDNGIGSLIIEMVQDEEYVQPEGFALTSMYNFLDKIAEHESAFAGDKNSKLYLDKYTFHDFRRVHITILALEWGLCMDVAQTHGHSTLVTTRKYYQWGLIQQRKRRSAKLKLNIKVGAIS